MNSNYFLSRNPVIDIFRGLSILSVILLHCYIHLPFDKNVLPPILFKVLFQSGYYGVMTFFVISGFLITNTSLKRWGALAQIPPLQFYKMRFARIAPCLIGLLIILSFLDIFQVKEFSLYNTSLLQALFSTLTFQLNSLENKIGYLQANWDVLWSLSIEEFFYLFFPLVCLICKNQRNFIFVILIFIVIGPFSRMTYPDNEFLSDRAFLSCIDGLAIGCLSALIGSWVRRGYKPILFFPGLMFFIFIFVFRTQAYHIGLSKIGINVTLLEIGVGLMLIATQGYQASDRAWSKPLRWFGRYSYEIYLTHMFFVTALTLLPLSIKHSLSHIGFLYVCVVVLSGLLGQLIAVNFSEPLNKYFRKAIKTDVENAQVSLSS